MSVMFAIIVWFVPGIGNSGLSTEDVESLQRTFAAEEVEFKDWPSRSAGWIDANEQAFVVADNLAVSLGRMQQKDREAIVLAGHSLGGRIVAETAGILGNKGLKVRRVCLLGAAFDRRVILDGRLARGSIEKPIIVCGEWDLALSVGYPLVEGTLDKPVGLYNPGGVKPDEYEWYVMPREFWMKATAVSLPCHAACVYIDFLDHAVKNDGGIKPGRHLVYDYNELVRKMEQLDMAELRNSIAKVNSTMRSNANDVIESAFSNIIGEVSFRLHGSFKEIERKLKEECDEMRILRQ